MGKKRLTRILVLLFCLVLCIGSILARNIRPFAQEQAEPMQADLEWLEEIRKIMSEGTSPYMAIPWSEQKPCEQYPYADWDGGTYVSSGQKIGEEKTGEYLGSAIAYGRESLDALSQTKNIRYIRHEKKAELYRIHEISERFAVAVRLEGEQKYYVYAREDYVPETLGDFVEDSNLKEYLEISVEFECGNNPEETYRGDIADALWDILLSQKEVKSQKKPHHSVFVSDEEVGDIVFSAAILYELTRWGHITFYVSEHGYIGINGPLLNPEYIFPVGKMREKNFWNTFMQIVRR